MKNIKDISVSFLIFFIYAALGMILMQGLPFGLIGLLLWHSLAFIFSYKYLLKKDKLVMYYEEYDLTSMDMFKASCILVVMLVIGQVVAYNILKTQGDIAYSAYQANSTIDPLIYFLTSLIIAPLSEELMFRGVLYRGLRDNLPSKFLAAIIVSILFAFMHGTMVHLYITFNLSLLTIIVYEKTGAIGYSVLVHLAYNVLSTFASGFIPIESWMDNQIFVAILAILLSVFLMSLLVIVLNHSKGRYKNEKEKICKEEKNA